jgi:hypothetical protein
MAITLGASGITYSDSTSNTTAPDDKGILISITSYGTAGTYTYTVPPNCSTVYVQLVGGGGGSAGYCESGGAGGYAEGMYAVTAGSAVTVTIGGGGGAVGYYAAAGNGGTSSFGGYISATGGYGANQNYSHGGGVGGLGSGGQINIYQGSGTGHANHGSHGQTGLGGGTFFGGGPSVARHTPSSAASYSYGPGTGASGNEGDDGSTGSVGASGLVIVYAYK